jgi:hypothetical protein
MPDDLVTIFETNDQVEVVLYRSMLEEAGVRVLETALRDPGLLHMPTELLVPRFRLQVFAADAERARALVEDFRRQAVEQAELMPAEAAEKPAEPEFNGADLRRFLIMAAIILLLVLLLIFLRPLFGW